MKKIFLSLSLLLTVAASTAFASDATEPSPGLQETFKQEFPGAQHVSWTYQEGYQKATFILGGRRSVAFFDSNNELAGSIRDLFYDQLPLTVMKAADKKFPEADFSEVREINNADGTTYVLTAESSSKKYKLKINSSGSITEVERVNK